MVPLYLDDNMVDKRIARQLRAAGHSIYLPNEVGTGGAEDRVHLETASTLGLLSRRNFPSLNASLVWIERRASWV